MARPPPITNRVKALREASGNMSQSALADAIGVTRQTIIAIEQGRYSPSLESAFRISRVFGVDVLKCSRCQGKMRLIAASRSPT